MVLTDRAEPERVVEPAYQRVFRRRDVFPDDPSVAEIPRPLSDSSEGKLLDCPADDPTTHQPCVDPQGCGTVFAVGHTDQRGDQAVVAEPVAEPDGQADRIGPAEQCEDILTGVPAGRQVELVGLGQ